MEFDKNRNVPNYTEGQAVSVVYRCILGLAIVVSLALPASMRNHDLEISAYIFHQSLEYAVQAASEHRRTIFDGRRLEYLSRSDAITARAASALATKSHN